MEVLCVVDRGQRLNEGRTTFDRIPFVGGDREARVETAKILRTIASNACGCGNSCGGHSSDCKPQGVLRAGAETHVEVATVTVNHSEYCVRVWKLRWRSRQ